MDADEVLRVIRAHQLASESIRGRTSRSVERLWLRLGSYRPDDVDRFARRAGSTVRGAQNDLIELEQAYLARMESAIREERVRPAGLSPREITRNLRGGADPVEVYRRPGVDVWTSLAAGRPLTAAVERGRHRVTSTAQTDMQLARTHTAQRVLGDDSRVVGYRRTLSPVDNCELCVTASERFYSRGELMPLHAGCHCGIAPVYGDQQDPRDALPAAEATSNLSDGDLITREHGEVGPTLARRDHDFTGPSEV